MNGDIQSLIKELEEFVTFRAGQKKILGADEMIEVSIKIKKNSKVTVTIESEEGKPDPDLMEVADFAFSGRVMDCLTNRNIRTVGDLRKTSLSDMRRLPNFGMKSAREIYDKLYERGIKLTWKVR